jgi:hypothetical protein
VNEQYEEVQRDWQAIMDALLAWWPSLKEMNLDRCFAEVIEAEMRANITQRHPA